MPEDDDIREVMEDEIRRGRRPTDPSARDRKKRELEIVRQMMWEYNEERFREVIAALGLAEGSPEHDAAVAAWREGQRQRKP
jgi:hypothetical protein